MLRNSIFIGLGFFGIGLLSYFKKKKSLLTYQNIDIDFEYNTNFNLRKVVDLTFTNGSQKLVFKFILYRQEKDKNLFLNTKLLYSIGEKKIKLFLFSLYSLLLW